jgi:hypothetical protein
MRPIKEFIEEGYEDHHLFPDYMQKILKKHEASPEEKARNAKRAAEARANAKPVNHKAEPYKPLGGRDEKSGRSYSEEVEQVEEGLKPEHNMRPGWMIKADPVLKAKIAANKAKQKEMKSILGKKLKEK